VARTRKQAGDGRYDLLDAVEVTAIGTTHAARHVLLGSPAVLTLVTPGVVAAADRRALLEEGVRAASRLRHDHIPPIDLAADGARLYVVQSPVDGDPLDRVLRETGALPVREALEVARQVADALALAHARGVVHGDLRPAVIRLRRGPSPHATVCDLATGPLSAALPATPGPYAAPERLAAGTIDARTDVFGLGLLVYELLEGRPLLPADAEESRALLLGDGEPLLPRFSALAPTGVPALVAHAVRRAPKDRYQSVAEVRAALDVCLQRLAQGQAAPKERPADERPRRKVVMVVDDTAGEVPEPAMPARIPGRILIATQPPHRSSRPARILATCLAAVGLGVMVASWLPPRDAVRAAPVAPPPAATAEPAHAPAVPVAALAAREPAADVEPGDPPADDGVAGDAGAVAPEAALAPEPASVADEAPTPPPAVEAARTAADAAPLPPPPAPAASRPAARPRISSRARAPEPRCATVPLPLGAGARARGSSPVPPTL